MIIFGKRNKDKNLKRGKKPDIITRGTRPVFGVELKDAVQNDLSFDGVPIPAVVRYSIDYVVEKGFMYLN